VAVEERLFVYVLRDRRDRVGETAVDESAIN
jgi:hypothetical protein